MSARSFALVPAAGASIRMGRPKLLLPLSGRPLILHTLLAWKQSRVDRVVVVVRPDDELLADVVRAAGVDLVIPPVAPPDMKASLAYGLGHLADEHRPADTDHWLVAPADMPGLSPRVINALLEYAAAQPGRIVIPTLAGHRGHPVLLPWLLASLVARLGESEGLSELINRHDPLLLACDAIEPAAARSFTDIDTPADLERFSDAS